MPNISENLERLSSEKISIVFKSLYAIISEFLSDCWSELKIELIKKITKENPILLLDDVLSELDSNRQNYLLNYIGKMQTIITCTGLDDFINNRFEIDRVFQIENGAIKK